MLKSIFEQYYRLTKGRYPFFSHCPSKYWDYFILKRYQDANLKDCDFQNPKTFNEKIRYLINNEKLDLKTQLTDKLYVKKWVDEKIGEGHCEKVYGIYNNFDEIDFNSLPQMYAIKANHGSKMNLFIFNNQKLTKEKKKQIKRIANNWLKANFFYFSMEPQYKNIEPKLFIEALHKPVDNKFQYDFQVHCFNGVPKFVEVAPPIGMLPSDAMKTIQFYDMDWNIQPFTYFWNHSEKPIARPFFVDEMLNYASILSKEFAYVRVDFTYSDNKVIFNEMTFSPSAGMVNFNLPQYNDILGSMIQLP